MRNDPRQDELASRLAEVRSRIASACTATGRDVGGVQLVVVTKFFPVDDIRRLAELGVTDVGESRDQEAREKLTGSALEGVDLTRHFIGQLQTNKAASVVSYADVVHTADRMRLVRALGSAADRAGRHPRVLVQVDLEGDGSNDEAHEGGRGAAQPARGGAAAADVPALADAISEQPGLVLAGVMAVAPRGGDPDDAFGRLRAVSERVRADHPEATWVSAGMSGDLEAAIRHGATHLRVGSAILGSRPALR